MKQWEKPCPKAPQMPKIWIPPPVPNKIPRYRRGRFAPPPTLYARRKPFICPSIHRIKSNCRYKERDIFPVDIKPMPKKRVAPRYDHGFSAALEGLCCDIKSLLCEAVKSGQKDTCPPIEDEPQQCQCNYCQEERYACVPHVPQQCCTEVIQKPTNIKTEFLYVKQSPTDIIKKNGKKKPKCRCKVHGCAQKITPCPSEIVPCTNGTEDVKTEFLFVRQLPEFKKYGVPIRSSCGKSYERQSRLRNC